MPLLAGLAAAAVAVVLFVVKASTLMQSENLPDTPRGRFARRMLDAMSRVDMRGIKRDLALALFSLETGDGQGEIFQKTNNPGSIKSTVGWSGKPSYKDTRVYPTLEDGVSDWVRLMHIPIYSQACAAAKLGDYRRFFDALDAAGYEKAINPSYNVRLATRYNTMKAEGIV